MTDDPILARRWIEIREESKDDILVFRPEDYPVPPARGRRHLELSAEGQGRALGEGSTDRLETTSEGDWTTDGRTLRLSIPGWEGEYEILDLRDTILSLRKR
ncbi:MAG TPA: hypothetical protein EYP40_05650 [Chromatiales bacterium]|nr:hypothetical protein [Chromatiales bacterium]